MVDKTENMKFITDVTTLIPGRQYWLVDKKTNALCISECMSDNHHLYFEGRIWAETDNNQAMDRWKIYGPVPVTEPPDFAAIEKADEQGIPAELQSMPISQEPKYGIRDNRLFNRISGEFIPTDEPIFILRGRDRTAILAMLYYATMCAQTGYTTHVLAVNNRVSDFEKFASEHPERMKFPDTILWPNFADQ